MGREIERKFLVANDDWRDQAGNAKRFAQFYLFADEDRSCRVRITDNASARLTLKTGRGISRGEFEYDIPLEDAEALREAAIGTVIAKTRHLVPNGRHVLEVDVYHGVLDGLVVAEIELESEDQAFERPDFLGRELTGDPRYLNQSLALHGRPDEDDDPAER